MDPSSKTDLPDFAALAAEACDLWQEHLATYAQDPEAKAAMMKIIEPQRQWLSGLFADYTAMMQNVRHDATSPSFQAATVADSVPAGTAATGYASDDIALRMAQLAHRVACLEKRCAELEDRLEGRKDSGNRGVAEASRSSEQAKP